MIFIYGLIFIFLLLISYQLFLGYSSDTLIEGLENATSTDTDTSSYKPYNINDPNNALILCQQNAGNIDYLKIRVDELGGIKQQVDNMEQNINSMQTQIDGLVQQQADYAQDLIGNEPVDVSGTNLEEETEEEMPP
jgi:hypothetical protein